jgi:hypothetical protein
MRNLRLKLGGIVVLVAAIGGNAAAQDPPPVADDPNAPKQPEAQPPATSEDEPITCPAPGPVAQAGPTNQPYQPPMNEQPAETHYHDWWHETGLALSAGGGVSDFVGTTMRDTTGTGGDWNVRLTLGTRSFIAGEVSYIGSAQSISALGLENNADLIGNGAQAALRLNGTVDYGVQPFAFGGAAWRHYSLHESGPNLSDVRNSADALEVPLGIGLAGYISGVMLEARGEYRFGWTDHDIVPTVTGESPKMDRWDVTGNIGYEF